MSQCYAQYMMCSAKQGNYLNTVDNIFILHWFQIHVVLEQIISYNTLLKKTKPLCNKLGSSYVFWSGILIVCVISMKLLTEKKSLVRRLLTVKTVECVREDSQLRQKAENIFFSVWVHNPTTVTLTAEAMFIHCIAFTTASLFEGGVSKFQYVNCENLWVAFITRS